MTPVSYTHLDVYKRQPLTTSHHKLGAIGFGSLHVVPRTNATLEFLRRAAAIVAQLLDTTLSSERLTASTDCSQIASAASPLLEPEPQYLDLRECASRDEAFQEMVGNSAPLQEVLRQVRTVAATDATVLLLGETGTGKELVARAAVSYTHLDVYKRQMLCTTESTGCAP